MLNVMALVLMLVLIQCDYASSSITKHAHFYVDFDTMAGSGEINST